MSITENQAKKILSGSVKCEFGQLAFNMLLKRLATLYKNDPVASVLSTCTQEINAFMKKYEKIMKNDYALIEKL